MTSTLKGIERHSHLSILVPKGGRRFIVLDPTAGHRLKDRVQIYKANGKLIKSFGVNDLLKDKELKDVSQSVSHIQWLGYDEAKKSGIWLSDDDSRPGIADQRGHAKSKSNSPVRSCVSSRTRFPSSCFTFSN